MSCPLSYLSSKITSVPAGVQAMYPDIKWAYHNSPILPQHKVYLSSFLEGSGYVGHIMVEGRNKAGGIQGYLADAMLNILHHQNS